MTRRTSWEGDYGYRDQRCRNPVDYVSWKDWYNSDTPESRAERNRLLQSWAKPAQFGTGKRPESHCDAPKVAPVVRHTTERVLTRLARRFRGEADIPGDPTGRATG